MALRILHGMLGRKKGKKGEKNEDGENVESHPCP